jgi:hypothetical protein
MGTSTWTWIAAVTHSMHGETSWRLFWNPQKQPASNLTIRHRHGTPTASTGFDSAMEVAYPATEVTDLAMEVAYPATEVTNSAREVTNPAAEVTSPAKEVANQAAEVNNLARGATAPTHAVHTQHAWTTCTRVASRSRPQECWRTALLIITTVASGGSRKLLTKLSRRPFKAIRREALKSALEYARDWSGIYAIKDVEEVHKFITGGIIAALDAVAPVKDIVVKTGSNLYLTRETLRPLR